MSLCKRESELLEIFYPQIFYKSLPSKHYNNLFADAEVILESGLSKFSDLHRLLFCSEKVIT